MRHLLTLLLAAAAASGQPASLADTVLGQTRTVYELRGAHPGLQLRPGAAINPDAYSLEILFAFTENANTARPILAATDRALSLNASHHFEFSRLGAGTYTYQTSQYVHLTLTVADNRARLYANGNLDLEFDATALHLAGPDSLLYLFPADVAGHPPAARVALLRVYPHALSADQAATLAANPFATKNSTEVPSFTVAGVRNGASFGEANPIAPNAFFSLFGSALSDATGDWTGKFSGSIAPTLLNGTRVLINDRPAFLSYTSPTQINGVAPDGLTPGPVTIVVERNGIRSAPVTVQARAVNPAFFTFEPRNRRYAAALSLDFTAYIAPADLFGVTSVNGLRIRPARAGDFVGVYGMGLGPTTPNLPAGTLPPVLNGGHPAIGPVQLRLGGQAVTPIYAGLANGLVGVYTVSFQVPVLPAGDHELIVTVNGISSPSGVFLPVVRDNVVSPGLPTPD